MTCGLKMLDVECKSVFSTLFAPAACYLALGQHVVAASARSHARLRCICLEPTHFLRFRVFCSVVQRCVTCHVHMQYTFILTASKQLPKQCTDYQSGKSKQRKSVGVRIADDAVLQVLALPCQIY